METQQQLLSNQATPASVLETASKTVASVVVVIYACGFLITSIHNFQYGFSEMNPFRPRILTAGAWFFLFLAVPFALVRQLAKTDAYKQSDVNGVRRLVNLSWAYILSCNFIVFASGPIFRFDTEPIPPAPPLGAWKVALWVIGIIALLVALAKYAKKLPKWFGTVFAALLMLNIAWHAFNDFFNLGRF